MKALLKAAVPLILGAAGGFIAAQYASHPSNEPAPAPAAPANSEQQQAPGSDVQTRELLERVRELEARLDEPATDPVAPPPEPPPLAPEDPKVAWQQQVSEARGESRDRSWAPRTEASLLTGLAPLAKHFSFRAKEGQCGTTRCWFNLAFDGAVTREAMSSILHQDFEPDCARAIEPDGERGATLIFDCRDSEE